METVKGLIYVVSAPFWICVFVFTDIVIPFGKFMTGAARGFAAQRKAHGDAGWALFGTLKGRGFLKPRGIPIAAIKHRFRWRRIYAHHESSVLLIAPKGQGKSQSFVAVIKDFCARKDIPIMVVFDPAGDIYKATGADLEARGVVVGVIDLANPSEGVSYDPLSFPNRFDLDNLDREVKLISEAIVAEEPGNKQVHFIDFVRLLVREAITNAILEQKGDIGHCVYQIVNAVERVKLMDSIKRRGTVEDSMVIDTYSKMTSGKGGMEAVGMMSTTLRALETWRIKAIRKAGTAKNASATRPRGWTWDDVILHEKPSAIFIKTGLLPGSAELVRVIMANAVNTVRRHWDKTGEPLHHGMLLIGDEMQKLGFCSAMLDANVELRKARVNNLWCFPSIGDVRRIYGEYADTLISGCELVVFGGSKESKYYEEISRLIGNNTEHSHSETEGEKRRSKHEIGVPLARPDWIRRLPYGELVAVMNDLNIHAGKLFEVRGDKIHYR